MRVYSSKPRFYKYPANEVNESSHNYMWSANFAYYADRVFFLLAPRIGPEDVDDAQYAKLVDATRGNGVRCVLGGRRVDLVGALSKTCHSLIMNEMAKYILAENAEHHADASLPEIALLCGFSLAHVYAAACGRCVVATEEAAPVSVASATVRPGSR